MRRVGGAMGRLCRGFSAQAADARSAAGDTATVVADIAPSSFQAASSEGEHDTIGSFITRGF